jgi:thioredoxin 1
MRNDIFEIDDASFDSQVLKSDKPVLVDFWAPWCGPCQVIGPWVEKLAETYGDRFRFAKCNIDQNPKTPEKYGIRAIPTLIIFQQGQVADQIIGAVGLTVLEDSIKSVLSGDNPIRV